MTFQNSCNNNNNNSIQIRNIVFRIHQNRIDIFQYTILKLFSIFITLSVNTK